YLWVFLTVGIVINLNFFDSDLTNTTAISSFVSRLLYITSPLALAAITLRPEKVINSFLFRNKNIPPHYIASESLSISQVINSTFLTKEHDNLWGTALVAIGLSILIFVPFTKGLTGGESATIYCIEAGMKLICLASSVIIGLYWIFLLRRDFRVKIEITWRYMGIISQAGWMKEYKDQIIVIEQSMRTGLWSKAKQQLDELAEEYKGELELVYGYLSSLLTAYYYLCGDPDSSSSYSQFPLSDFKKSFDRVRILGMEYHNSKVYSALKSLAINYEYLKKVFEYYLDILNRRLDVIDRDALNFNDNQATVQNSQAYQSLLELIPKLSHHLRGKVHLNLVGFDFQEFKEVRNYVLQNSITGLTHWFENTENPSDLVNSVLKPFREKFRRAIKNKFGTEPGTVIHDRIGMVNGWIVDFLDLTERDADMWFEATGRASRELA
ncbi:MAG: hypothetical protein ACFFD4_38690, partial [Candidatus Odinarchaeota archaeon]